MLRFASAELDNWLKSDNRKPMVIRGARQVGKTWIVRDFAQSNNLELIEINLERFPNLADLFSDNDPEEIIKNIEAELSTEIVINSSVLFLDEIQVAPELLAKLRWFMEEMPELPVIAAGSLLEFALKKNDYSMPVGRISYFYLEQMSFFEFILAAGNKSLYEKLISFSQKKRFPESLHLKCLKFYQEFCLVGGMPEVVSDWIKNKNLKNCIKIQQDLLATYRDDFHKYGGEIDAGLLSKIMLSIAKQLGNKFVYSRVDANTKSIKIKKHFTHISMAKICTHIYHTTGNGVPLGAESNEKFFKAVMLDIGLVSVQLGLSSMKLSETKEIIFSNKGGIAEQFVGQQLRAMLSPLSDPQVYYWQRTHGRQGEIDYILQYGNKIIPIEVKSGSAGSMKSLHQFMADKNLNLAVRFNTNMPIQEDMEVKTTLGTPVSYKLLSMPIYLVERIYDFISSTYE